MLGPTSSVANTESGILPADLFDICSTLDGTQRISLGYYVTVICEEGYKHDPTLPDVYIDAARQQDSDGIYVSDLISAIMRAKYKPPGVRRTLVGFEMMNNVLLVAVFRPSHNS